MKRVVMNIDIERDALSFEDAERYFYYDAYLGKVYWRERNPEEWTSPSHARGFNTRFANKEAGRTNKDSFCTVGLTHNGTVYTDISIPRLVCLLYTGEWPDGLIRHVDGDIRNNRPDNLEDMSRAEMQKQIRKNSRNTSGYTGVTKYAARAHLPNPWIAQIQTNGETFYLGAYPTKLEAAKRYEAARAWFGHTQLYHEFTHEGEGLKGYSND